jgi:hypothetical protein
MYDQFITTLAARPDATILPSIEGNIQQTHEALTAILDGNR